MGYEGYERQQKDWQRSDGRLRSVGRDDRDTNRKLSAYHRSERERTQENRPSEMTRLESSFGGVAFGANRRGEMTMVVHEKRRPEGRNLKKDEREVEGRRTAPISELRGDFRTNSHSRRESAFAYREELDETPQRMMERLQEMMDENRQSSGEKVLPFLDRRADRETAREITERLRESREKKDAGAYRLWERRREEFRAEETEKRETRRRFYRELVFAREKSRRLMRQDSLSAAWDPQLLRGETAGTEDGSEPEGEGIPDGAAEKPWESRQTMTGDPEQITI